MIRLRATETGAPSRIVEAAGFASRWGSRRASGTVTKLYGEWRSLVARCVRDAEVVGSNPASPTKFPQVSRGARPGCFRSRANFPAYFPRADVRSCANEDGRTQTTAARVGPANDGNVVDGVAPTRHA
jgi:hypothetical protein